MTAAGAGFYLLDVQGRWACHGEAARRIRLVTKPDKTKWLFTETQANPNHPIPQATCVATQMWQAIEELTKFDAVAIVDIRPGRVEGTWEHYVVAVVAKQGSTVAEEISEEDAV